MNTNNIQNPQGSEPSEIKESKLPTSLMVAVGIFTAYSVLKLLFIALDVLTDYSSLDDYAVLAILFSGAGIIVLWAIIAWVLLRVVKYGWGVSVFFVCGGIYNNIAKYVSITSATSDSEILEGALIVSALYVVLLLSVLIALLMPSSRKSFRLARITRLIGTDVHLKSRRITRSTTMNKEAKPMLARDKVSLLLGVFLVVFSVLILFTPHEEVEKVGLLPFVYFSFFLFPVIALIGTYLGWTSLKKGANKFIALSAISLNVIICLAYVYIFFIGT